MLSSRAHPSKLRCFLKFPPNLPICGYQDLTGLLYPPWFHHLGENRIQRSNPEVKLPARPVKTLSDTVNHILGTYLAHLSPLGQFCHLCRGHGIHVLRWSGGVGVTAIYGGLAISPTPLLFLPPLPSHPCSQRAATLRLMACSPRRSVSCSRHMVLLHLPS